MQVAKNSETQLLTPSNPPTRPQKEGKSVWLYSHLFFTSHHLSLYGTAINRARNPTPWDDEIRSNQKFRVSSWAPKTPQLVGLKLHLDEIISIITTTNIKKWILNKNAFVKKRFGGVKMGYVTHARSSCRLHQLATSLKLTIKCFWLQIMKQRISH